MKIGIIGAGHMGSALIKGLVRSGKVSAENIYVKGGTNLTAEKLQKKIGYHLVKDYQGFASCEIIFLAVGAKIALKVVKELAPFFSRDQLLISVAIGHTQQDILEILGQEAAIIHAIPNTPVSVNEGVIGVAYAESLEKSQQKVGLKILASLGTVKIINESQLPIFGTVAGCSPAYVDVFMEALSDASVMEGLPRELSYEVIAQMIFGTAKLALETRKHPGELKDGVTSPGGSTIKGIAALEKNGFRYAVIDAIKQANQ